MSSLSLIALTVWALCFSGAACGSARVQSPQSSEKRPVELPAPPVLTLTQDHPNYSLPIKAVAGNPGDAEILEVAITKVTNPSLTPIAISIYLSYTEAGKSEPSRQLVGNFSLYPPDQPGKFLLNAASTLRKVPLSNGSAKGNEARLEFEMKRIDETRGWTPVEVTIAQPTWRAAEK